jgi:FLVCR family MFS transporter 7
VTLLRRFCTQFVAAMVQPMSLNLAARLTMDWFPAEERDVATTVATMANVAGQMLFSLAPPWLVRTPAQLGRLMLFQLLPNIAVTAVAAAALAERPPCAPSAAAAQQWRERASAPPHAGFPAALSALAADARALARNANFLLLAAGFSVGTGTAWAVLVLEAQLVTPCGYSDATAGAAGAALLGAGVLAAFLVGGAMEATHAYVELQRAVMAAALLATAGVFAAARPGDTARLILAWCALGCALQPLMPLTLEHAAEMTFPLSADVSTSALFVAANTLSFLLALALTPLLRPAPGAPPCAAVVTPASVLVVALMAAGFALTCFVKKDYRRTAAERRRESGGGLAAEPAALESGGLVPAAAEQPDSPLLGDAAAALHPRYDAVS